MKNQIQMSLMIIMMNLLEKVALIWKDAINNNNDDDNNNNNNNNNNTH